MVYRQVKNIKKCAIVFSIIFVITMNSLVCADELGEYAPNESVAAVPPGFKPVSIPVDSYFEGPLSDWKAADIIAGEEQGEYVYVQMQMEKLHNTKMGLLFTCKNIIQPTENGTPKRNDSWVIFTKKNFSGPFLEMDKYTRITCWVKIVGQRNPLVGLVAYFHNPKRPRRPYDIVAARTPVEPNQWTKLVLTFDHIPPEIRKKPMTIGLFRNYFRPEPGDNPEEMLMFVDDWRLERQAERKWKGTDADPAVIIVNQIGFSPYDCKTAILNGANPAQMFRVRKTENDEIAYENSFEGFSNRFGNFKKADFSSITTPGRYYVEAGGVRSVNFDIAPDLYAKTAKAHEYTVRNMRLGAKTERHDPALLDTALGLSSGKFLDLSGGYHDAGDLRKYNVNPIMALLVSVDAAKAARKAGHPDEEYVTEARWAAKFLEKLINAFGPEVLPGRIEATRKGVPYVMSHNTYYTDNKIGTKDDHVIWDGKGMMGMQNSLYLGIAEGFASLANLLGPETKDGKAYLKRALEIWNAHQKLLKIQCDQAVACSAAIELYKATKDEAYAEKAKNFSSVFIRMQEHDLIDSKLGLSGFYYDGVGSGLQGYLRSVYTEPAIPALAALCRTFPDDEMWNKWRMSLMLYAKCYTQVAAGLNEPYGCVSTFDRNPKKWTKAMIQEWSIPVGKDREGRQFFICSKGYVGASLAYSKISMILARELEDLDILEIARKQYGFMCGENPFNAMLCTGMGEDECYDAYTIDGRIPGQVLGSFAMLKYKRFCGVGGREAYIKPTLKALNAAAMLSEPFVLSGNVIAGENNPVNTIVIKRPDNSFEKTIKVQKDGTFGPVTLLGGGKYMVSSGKKEYLVNAVPGVTKQLKLFTESEVTLTCTGIELSSEGSKGKTVVLDDPGKPIIYGEGQKITVKLKVSKEGNMENAVSLLVSDVNTVTGKTEIPVNFEDGKTDVELTLPVEVKDTNKTFYLCIKPNGFSNDMIELIGLQKIK